MCVFFAFLALCLILKILKSPSALGIMFLQIDCFTCFQKVTFHNFIIDRDDLIFHEIPVLYGNTEQGDLLANRVFSEMDLHFAQLLSNVQIICIPEESCDLPPCCAECGCFIGNGNDGDDRFWSQSWFHTQPWICHSPQMIPPLLQKQVTHFTAWMSVCTSSCVHEYVLYSSAQWSWEHTYFFPSHFFGRRQFA